MIAPRSILLWLVGIIPAAAILRLLLSAVSGGNTDILGEPLNFYIAVAMIVLSALAIIDATLGLSVLDGLKVAGPDVVRMNKDSQTQFDIKLSFRRRYRKKFAIAPALPEDFFSPVAQRDVELDGSVESYTVSWPCTALRRGRYFIRECFLRARSPLGLWNIRRKTDLAVEVRVYPNLMSERKHLAALFLNRGGFGVHAQRQIGQGREFEKLREYVPGDAYGDIHWKATAKRGRPVTKIFQIERTQEVYVILDASRLSSRLAQTTNVPALQATGRSGDAADPAAEIFQPQPADMMERFVNAALVLAVAADKQGDHFGLLTFSNGVDRFLRAGSGRSHFRTCRDVLYAVEPKLVTPDFTELFTFLRTRLRRRALLVFLTSLDDPILAETFVRDARLIARQHLVLVNSINDAGTRPLFAGEPVGSTAGLYDALAGHIRWRRLMEIKRILKNCGVAFNLLDSEAFCPQLVSQYVSVKRRQLI